MTSWKSSMEAEIVSKLMSVVGFAMVYNGSSCLSNKVTYCNSMVFFCVQNLGEVKWNLDVNVSRGSRVMCNIFENQFWFRKV
jgi:hypothetical protein